MQFKRINKKYWLFFCIALITSTGCSKFLDEQDPSNLTPDGYYTIPEHAEAAIAAAFSNTRFIGGGAGIFAQNFSMLEAVTGTSKTETGQNTDLNNLLGLAYNGDNVFVRNWWNGLYGVIAQTNLVLQKVPGISPMNEAQKQKILGEARFLRACMHHINFLIIIICFHFRCKWQVNSFFYRKRIHICAQCDYWSWFTSTKYGNNPGLCNISLYF